MGVLGAHTRPVASRECSTCTTSALRPRSTGSGPAIYTATVLAARCVLNQAMVLTQASAAASSR